ncbi:MAG: nitrate- and nitrite sensing domain-containing protein [Pseudomonadota bacterium]
MNLNKTVMLALILPLVACGVALQMLLLYDVERLSELRDRGQLIELTRKSSALMHELQIERGRTVGAITADFASAFVEPVRDQRDVVDLRWAEWTGFLAASELLERVPEMEASTQEVITAMGAIERFRIAVDSEAVTKAEVVTRYTDLINALLTLVYKSVDQSPNIKLASLMLPMVTLIEAKEHGGLERAFGSALFNEAAAGAVSPTTYAAYFNRLRKEQGALRRFMSHAAEHHRTAFNATVRGGDVDQVHAWRDVLKDISTTGDGDGISGKDWFDVATTRLNLFREVEEGIADEASGSLARQDSAMVFRLSKVGTVGALALLMAIGLAIWVGVRAGRGQGGYPWLTRSAATGLGSFAGESPSDDLDTTLGNLRSLSDRLAATAPATEEGRVSAEQRMALEAAEAERHGRSREVMERKLSAMAKKTGAAVQELIDQADRLCKLGQPIPDRADEKASTLQGHVVVSASGDQPPEKPQILPSTAEDPPPASVTISEAATAIKVIAERVTVIQDAAHQTDLIVLNAAVEAARASNQGLGFVVVAQEMRKLADCSGRAAEEIERLAGKAIDAPDKGDAATQRILSEILRTAETIDRIARLAAAENAEMAEIRNALHALAAGKSASTGMVANAPQGRPGHAQPLSETNGDTPTETPTQTPGPLTETTRHVA